MNSYFFRNLYLDHIGGDAVPQREDAFVFDNLCETVSHSAEMDVNSAEMWEVRALSLRQGEASKEREVLNQTPSSWANLICRHLIYNNNIWNSHASVFCISF